MANRRNNLAQYQRLIDRADFELMKAQEIVPHLALSYNRVARLQRARREIQAESEAVTEDRQQLRLASAEARQLNETRNFNLLTKGKLQDEQ